MIGVDDTLGGKLLQNASGADAGFELRLLGRRGRGFANIGRRKDQLAERDITHLAGGRRGLLLRLRGGGT